MPALLGGHPPGRPRGGAILPLSGLLGQSAKAGEGAGNSRPKAQVTGSHERQGGRFTSWKRVGRGPQRIDLRNQILTIFLLWARH